MTSAEGVEAAERADQMPSASGTRLQPLTVTKIVDPKGLRECAELWQRLSDSRPEAELFGTWEWAGSWLEAFSRLDSPAAFLVLRGRSLVGVFPFLRHDQSTLCRGALAFPGDHSSLLFAPGAGSFEALARHLSSTLPDWRVTLTGCRPGSPTALELESYAGVSATACLERPDQPSQIVDLAEGWGAYLGARDSRVRHEWRRKRKKLERAGRVEVVTFTRPCDCDQALESFFAIERRSWKNRIRSSLAEEGQHQFHTLLAARAAARNWLRLHVLYLDSRPIAHLYAVRFRNQLHAVATSYDLEYAALSPGLAVVLHAIESAACEGVARIDLLGSQARWKAEVGSSMVERVSLCVRSGTSWRCSTCQVLEAKAKPFIRRRLPMLVSWRKWLQDRGRGHRESVPGRRGER